MAMLIRPASPDDLPAIISLLRQSLGESTTRKSESFWKWKHEQNPFGPSFVLVAEEDDAIIGVRAFMKWEWNWKGQLLKAIRAVDTATHPRHQGKGIFKKLTLQQIGICKDQGVDFVFNTPNGQSLPGYLKMGWVEQGRMPLKFHVRNPFTLAAGMLKGRKRPAISADDPSPFQEWSHSPSSLIGQADPAVLTTALSPAYIHWRYAVNPVCRYNYFTDDKTFLLITRIKPHTFGNELRIVDFILTDPSARRRYLGSRIRQLVTGFCREHKLGIISLSGQQYRSYPDCFSWMGLIPVRNAGPIITLRDLNMNERFPLLTDQRNWGYSMGDMELF